jgi:hypothetical protein
MVYCPFKDICTDTAQRSIPPVNARKYGSCLHWWTANTSIIELLLIPKQVGNIPNNLSLVELSAHLYNVFSWTQNIHVPYFCEVCITEKCYKTDANNTRCQQCHVKEYTQLWKNYEWLLQCCTKRRHISVFFSNEVLFIARKLTTKVTATVNPKIHKQFMNSAQT